MSSKIKIEAANFKGESRKKYVTHMFDSIAEKYDFLNHVLSFGVDILWRKRAVKLIDIKQNHTHLDLATGTGDFAFEVAKNDYVKKIVGLDISTEMIKFANIKNQKNINSNKIEFIVGDAEKLPFEDSSLDSVSISFGIRNFGNQEQSLKDIHRVLKPNGQLIILEFAKNKTPIIGILFNFYFKYVLPKIGALLSKDKEAYTYLPDSVETFPSQNEFLKLIEDSGFATCYYKNYTFGISTLFYGQK